MTFSSSLKNSIWAKKALFRLHLRHRHKKSSTALFKAVSGLFAPIPRFARKIAFLTPKRVFQGTASLILSLLVSISSWAVDLEKLERDLETGITGWVHGAASEFRQYVFTYRNEKDFFDHVELSMVAADESIRVIFSTLQRHDKIWVKGYFAPNPSPQKHMVVKEIRVVEPYLGGPPFDHEAKLPQELMGKDVLTGVVHAVASDGKILVIEYKDAIVPVVMGTSQLAKGLYRGDRVRVRFQVQGTPRLPVHLRLDLLEEKPLEILEKMVDSHGKKLELEGYLGLFKKSPQITRDVFALVIENEDGSKRNFTLVNFEEEQIWKAIHEKLKVIWDENKLTMQLGRNLLINKNVRLKILGVGNVVSPSQANPQLLISGPEKIVKL